MPLGWSPVGIAASTTEEMERRGVRILFLDDDVTRRESMRDWLPGATLASSAEQCTWQLTRQPWDLVFLDYDLGRARDTGGVVASDIANYKLPVKAIVIHSRNIHGSRHMETILTAAGYPVRQVCFDDMPGCLNEIMEWAIRKESA